MADPMILWNTIAGVLVAGMLLYGWCEWVAGKRARTRMNFEARRAIRQADEQWEALERAVRVRTDLRCRALLERADFLLETRTPPLRLLAVLNEPVDVRELEAVQ